jgi:hypothetical protein
MDIWISRFKVQIRKFLLLKTWRIWFKQNSKDSILASLVGQELKFHKIIVIFFLEKGIIIWTLLPHTTKLFSAHSLIG